MYIIGRMHHQAISGLKMTTSAMADIQPSPPSPLLNGKLQQQINSIKYKLNQKTTKITSSKNIENENDAKPKPTMIRMSREDVNDYIDNDIVDHLAKKTSWKRMDRTMQWRLIENYIKAIDKITDGDISKIKNLFISKQLLNVQYNGEHIEKLNITLKLKNSLKEETI